MKKGALGLVFLLGACASRPATITKLVNGRIVESRPVDPDAYEHVARAGVYEEQGRFDDAADEIKRALNYDPGAPELQARLAEALIRLSRLDEAAQIIAASRKTEETTAGLVAFGHLLQAQGNAEAAVAPMRRAAEIVDLSLSPSDAERIYLELAEAQILALDLDAAAATLRGLGEKLPRSVSARLRLGAVAWARGAFDDARKALTEAISIEPNQIDAILTLAWLDTAQGRQTDARAGFALAFDRSDSAPEVALARIRFLMATGSEDAARVLVDDLVAADATPESLPHRIEMERAVKRATRALDLLQAARAAADDAAQRTRFDLLKAEILDDDPGTRDASVRILRAIPATDPLAAKARLRAATIVRGGDKPADAMSLLDEATKLAGPDDLLLAAQIALARALTLDKAGDLPGAVRALDTQLGRDPGNAHLVIAKAGLVERHGRWQDALAMADGVIKQAPENAEALNFWGFVAVDHAHQIPRGLRRLRTALALEPGSGAILDSVGWAHFRAGQIGPATAFLEQAGRLEPEDPEILGHLADLYSRGGDPARATLLLKKALGHTPEATLRATLEGQLKKLVP